MSPAMSKTTVYRFFDAEDRLLYVGMSVNALARLLQHKSTAAAWFWDVARISVEHFDTRSDATHAEALAISKERPIHNAMKRVPSPGFVPGDALSSPCVPLRETKVRITDRQRQRIEALVGKNRMAAFIREAVSEELAIREAQALKTDPSKAT